MTVQEHSLGPLYLARVKITKRCAPHVVVITEVNPPWRRGRAVLLAYRRTRAMTLGLWRRKSREVQDEDAPEFLSLLTYTPADIGEWDDGSQ